MNDNTISTLRCPFCGGTEELRMPTDACLFFHQCVHCAELIRPTHGDCCVFCSFGDKKCPMMQDGADSCCQAEPTPRVIQEAR